MRSRVIAAAAAPVIGIALLAGCAKNQNENRIGVLERGEGDYLFVQGDGQKAWYSALELRRVAENYVREKQLGFPIENSEVSIWAYTDKRKMLAEVWFTQGPGKPTLGVEIDRRGRVIRHRMGIGIDRDTTAAF